jgi:hypothetical protein
MCIKVTAKLATSPVAERQTVPSEATVVQSSAVITISAPAMDLKSALLSKVILLAPTLQTVITQPALAALGAVKVFVVPVVTAPAAVILFRVPHPSAVTVAPAVMVSAAGIAMASGESCCWAPGWSTHTPTSARSARLPVSIRCFIELYLLILVSNSLNE